MMIDRAMIFGLVASVAALLFILELVRQRRLRRTGNDAAWHAAARAVGDITRQPPVLMQSLIQTLLFSQWFQHDEFYFAVE